MVTENAAIKSERLENELTTTAGRWEGYNQKTWTVIKKEIDGTKKNFLQRISVHENVKKELS